MADMKADIQKALDYIEANLTEDLKIGDIARQSFLSPFYFQRVFGALCGIPVGEYIRSRRLTLAAEELAASEAKVIDIAARYGYDSPDSFNRAFQRFHGLSPSGARKAGAALRSCGPIKLTRTLEGGSMMEYKIVQKPQFTVMGVSRRFHPETSYQQIPQYWTELFGQPGFPLMGVYGICIDDNSPDGTFEYWIADNYIPHKALPEGCGTKVIPGGLWAVFPCKLKTLQQTNTRMWQEWLPNCREYRLSGQYDLEVYGPLCEEDPGETYVELWLTTTRKYELCTL